MLVQLIAIFDIFSLSINNKSHSVITSLKRSYDVLLSLSEMIAKRWIDLQVNMPMDFYFS